MSEPGLEFWPEAMRNSAEVAHKELCRYKVSHLKHGEAVLKVGQPRGEKKQISLGNDNKKNKSHSKDKSRFPLGMTSKKSKGKDRAPVDGLDCLRAGIGSMIWTKGIRTDPAAMF